MLISVIIPAFNEEKLLPQTLESLKRAAAVFTARGYAWECVVCDNNSTDRTAEIARTQGAKVVFEPVNQIGRARNTGAGAATGDWFIFLDADSHPSSGLLDDVIDAIESGKILAGGSTLEIDVEQRIASGLVRLWNRISRWRRYVAGSFIFVEAQAFRAVGGFDITLYASEEIDLSKRLKKLARSQNKQVTILHRHPLLTSARKLKLYTWQEHILFLSKTVLGGGRTLKSREACHTWYDGRR